MSTIHGSFAAKALREAAGKQQLKKVQRKKLLHLFLFTFFWSALLIMVLL